MSASFLIFQICVDVKNIAPCLSDFTVNHSFINLLNLFITRMLYNINIQKRPPFLPPAPPPPSTPTLPLWIIHQSNVKETMRIRYIKHSTIGARNIYGNITNKINSKLTCSCLPHICCRVSWAFYSACTWPFPNLCLLWLQRPGRVDSSWLSS